MLHPIENLEKETWPDPHATDHDFRESKFFSTPGLELPDTSTIGESNVYGVITLPELSLVVKKGQQVRVDEAITAWAIRKAFRGDIPVPEVYGWKVREGCVFIYMELIPGATLLDRWDGLDLGEKAAVCNDLKGILLRLRQLPRSLQSRPFIGSITGGPLLDRAFDYLPLAGPFTSLGEFYAWMEWLPQRFLEQTQRYKDPFLQHMPAESKSVFTHADVHASNIMVRRTGSPQILAIIDWGQSGWYPEWWEYFKMVYTTGWESDWRETWMPEILEARPEEANLMLQYVTQIGAI